MVTINGEQKNGYEGVSLTDILDRETYDIRRVAVEINGEIVPKSQFPETVVSEGDCIEVVSFVGGG